MLRREINRRVRRTLQHVGRRMNEKQLEHVKSVHSYLEIGSWLASLPTDPPEDVDTRFDVFSRAVDRVDGQAPLYLEFGVFQGESLRWWSDHLTQPAARLVGFDSFEGLPEDWRRTSPRGYFSTGGAVPDIDDPRVSYEVGWFDKALPAFTVPEHDQLILNVDADLYSSAALVLEHLEPYLRPGTLIYFDELNDRDHELRAFRESLKRSGKTVLPIAMAQGGVQWLFQYT